MKIRSLAAMSGLACIALLGIPAEAAEIKVLSAIAMQKAVEDLGPKFEQATGHRLTVTFATLGAIVKRVRDGETPDVVIGPQQGIDALVKDGKAVAGSVALLARSGISVAVRQGAPRPDISSPEALKRALLAAKSISYTSPAGGGASGIHFAKVLDRLGIAEEMKSKTVFPKTVEVGAAIARNWFRSTGSTSSARCQATFRPPSSCRRLSWPAPMTPRHRRRWSTSCARAKPQRC
jgi:molybdate transport system substrate-binding protein